MSKSEICMTQIPADGKFHEIDGFPFAAEPVDDEAGIFYWGLTSPARYTYYVKLLAVGTVTNPFGFGEPTEVIGTLQIDDVWYVAMLRTDSL